MIEATGMNIMDISVLGLVCMIAGYVLGYAHAYIIYRGRKK
jgi:hypothetical protein